MTIEIQGLNLEKLLREAQDDGIVLKKVRRTEQRKIAAKIAPSQWKAVSALCSRFGWEVREIQPGLPVRALRFLKRRFMLPVGAGVCLLMIALSSHMILAVDVTGAQEYDAEVRRFLSEEGVAPGRFKRALSIDTLRERLLLRLPGVSYVGMRYAGSVIEIDCRLARDGEQVEKEGGGLDLVADEPGIIAKLVVISGTPQVAVGDAVYAGQVLIKGEERTQKGETIPVEAQGQVTARVWTQGKARASLYKETTRETGRTRTRVTINTPWHSRVVREAQAFEQQDVSVKTEKVIDLFVPLWRRIETYSEIEIEREPRDQADAASRAQGAAENIAKKQLPAGVLILDKWVDYSMIDNEFVYATVVLEYERDVAVRAGAQ